MADRRPRPGDDAVVLPGGTEYSDSRTSIDGMMCRVDEECWAAHAYVDGMKQLAAMVGQKLSTPFNMERPFWHVYINNTMYHVHEDYLQPIDPNADEREQDTSKPTEVTEA